MDAARGAAAIQVDLAIAKVGADPRRRHKLARMAAAELKRNRLLGGIEANQALDIAVDHRRGGDHLGIEQRAAGEEPMESPTMAVGAFHHRRDGEAVDHRGWGYFEGEERAIGNRQVGK